MGKLHIALAVLHCIINYKFDFVLVCFFFFSTIIIISVRNARHIFHLGLIRYLQLTYGMRAYEI